MMEPTDSGTANLIAPDLPPYRLAAGMKNLDRLAKSIRGPGETRTMANCVPTPSSTFSKAPEPPPSLGAAAWTSAPISPPLPNYPILLRN